MDNGAIYFSKGNTWQNSGDPTSGASKTGAAHTDLISTGYSWYPIWNTFYPGLNTAQFNFGQIAFQNTTVWSTLGAAGYKTLCTANLPAPAAGLWTPDLVWIKDRTTANNHAIADTVRGAFQMIGTNLGTAEASTAQAVQKFYPGGFTVGSDVTTGTNNDNYISWMWRAGGPVAVNTDGSITSYVSKNTTAGFSIVNYTGNGSTSATVGHGLGQTPVMIIIKARNNTSGWEVFHKSLSASYGIRMDTANGQFAASSVNGGIISTSPTSSIFGFTPGSLNANNVNENNINWIAYCFAEIEGYSKFGSYVGAGATTDNTFVYCGFRPRWILIKDVAEINPWLIYDTVRNTYNASLNTFRPELSNAEGQYAVGGIDILSNGFKIRTTDGALGDGHTHIFAAFAEMPFKYANAR